MPLFQDPQSQFLVMALPGNEFTEVTDVASQLNTNLGCKTFTTRTATPVTGATAKYYSRSLYFNGSTSKIITSNSSDFDLGTGAFTLEAWMYAINFNNNLMLFTWGDGNYRVLRVNSGGINIESPTGNASFDALFPTTMTTGTWHHVALVRNSSGHFTAFLNGNPGTTITNRTTVAIGDSSNAITIGFKGGTEYSAMYMQDYRLYKGVAKYTSAFTPPTQIWTSDRELSVQSGAYIPIQSFTLQDNLTTQVHFKHIPQGFTDLVLMSSVKSVSGTYGEPTRLYFNMDTNTNYSFVNWVSADIVYYGRPQNQTNLEHGQAGAPTGDSWGFAMNQIMDYSSTNKLKSMLTNYGNAFNLQTSSTIAGSVNTWRSIEAIHSISIYLNNGYAFAAGSTFNLYGLKGI